MADTSYYTEDTKKGCIKRNVSNEDCDSEEEEVMLSWVIAAALQYNCGTVGVGLL